MKNILILQKYRDIIDKNQENLYFQRSDCVRVYEKVRAYIDEMGYKQVNIARKAGISTSTFNAMMNGKRTMYADDLSSICLALNVSPELFIEVKNPCKKHSVNYEFNSEG